MSSIYLVFCLIINSTPFFSNNEHFLLFFLIMRSISFLRIFKKRYNSLKKLAVMIRLPLQSFDVENNLRDNESLS